jgi:hypothetical protein
MSKWFEANRLSLKVDKTDAIKLSLNHSKEDSFQITCKDKEIKQVSNKISWFGN